MTQLFYERRILEGDVSTLFNRGLVFNFPAPILQSGMQGSLSGISIGEAFTTRTLRKLTLTEATEYYVFNVGLEAGHLSRIAMPIGARWKFEAEYRGVRLILRAMDRGFTVKQGQERMLVVSEHGTVLGSIPEIIAAHVNAGSVPRIEELAALMGR